MKVFDPEELSQFNGKEGRPVYIAHGGKVYDVSESKMWRTGTHMQRHRSGADLTTDLQAAPHGNEVFERFPQVGELKTHDVPEINIPPLVAKLLEQFPFLRRHPHPMTVHFPIVCMLFVPVFSVLYLLTGHIAFESTAFHLLGIGILFTLVAISTGVYTWWLNYLAQPVRSVRIKLPLSLVMLVTAIATFLWRLNDPQILLEFHTGSLFYLLLVLSLVPMITVIGWFGAMLTFPIEHE